MIQPLTLRVETPYFVAGAIFEKIYGVWSCVKAAPEIAWMTGKSPKEIHLGLLKMEADYDWLSPDGTFHAPEGNIVSSAGEGSQLLVKDEKGDGSTCEAQRL
jgi:hypothetical protein